MQTKSLQDAQFMLFEEAALKAGVLPDIPELKDPEAWRSANLHALLAPGQLIRCTAHTRIVDSELAKDRIDRFIDLARIIVRFTPAAEKQPDTAQPARPPPPPLRSRGGRAKRRTQGAPKAPETDTDELVTALLDGTSPEMVLEIGRFVALYFGNQVSLRQFPCGEEFSDFSLAGPLLPRPGYLQEEREALFTKYGSGASEWTMVAQVATVPRPPTPDAAQRRELLIEEELAEPQSVVTNAPEPGAPETSTVYESEEPPSRIEFEAIATEMMEAMESMGVAGGPIYPSIAVTPLAVYRTVPTYPLLGVSA